MALPNFSAGQRVSIMRSNGFAAPAGAYRVVRALPKEAGPRQYQIRNEGENFDRIVEESRLEPISND
jgi:hypothetical protein